MEDSPITVYIPLTLYGLFGHAYAETNLDISTSASNWESTPLVLNSRFRCIFKIMTFISLMLASLSPSIDLLQGRIESQLSTRNQELVHWFRAVELPRIAGCFMPLFKKWSAEYAGRSSRVTRTVLL